MEKIWALSDDEVDFYFAELFKQGGAQNELPSGQFWIRRYSKLIATGSSGFINLIQSMEKDIRAYNKAQSTSLKKICDVLAKEIDQVLGGAESKIWHGGPVWFIEGNPIVGYWVRKSGSVQLLFWSGQSFDEPGLKAEGKFKAAEAQYTDVGEIKVTHLRRWLKKSKKIQWDYKNIVKRRGVLKKLEI